ncbi:MAG: VOC family protein [Solirubrobacteraceae bacterium]
MIEAAVPVLQVRDLVAALHHYERLGFDIRRDARNGLGSAARDGVRINLSQSDEPSPRTWVSVVYLDVDDADALYDECRGAAVRGRLRAPHDTEFPMREGSHLDPDGNVIRFGSPTRSG